VSLSSEIKDALAGEFKNLTPRQLVSIILKQREHYGDALLKVSRLARQVGRLDIADVALTMRENYGLGDGGATAPTPRFLSKR
jgi:hypothetical protein